VKENTGRSLMALVLAAAVLSFVAIPVIAATQILTPAGTKVALKFVDPVDTAKAVRGDVVHFRVAADVIANGHTVIKAGTGVAGSVIAVGHPFPQNAGFATISSLAVRAIDHKTSVPLKDVRVSAPMFGGNKRVPAGSLTTTTTKTDVVIRILAGTTETAP
jgi:hypothetical protein